MHQSSFHIITRFRELVDKNYPQSGIEVLDVGSYGVNGTYKEIFSDTVKYHYTGLDVNAGPNVDYVPADPYNWPELPDESFDVIISGQAFEHIEHPWLIMEEMSRVLKKNGLICIVAPSRGPEHKYPVDCWRYYPDGFRALAKWVDLQVIDAKTNWGKSGFDDGSDQWGDSFCILYKPENKIQKGKRRKRDSKPLFTLNSNNPLRQDKQISYYGFSRPEVIDAINRNGLPTSKVLEIGCAGGATAKALKEKLPVQSYVGIDISAEAAAIAQKHLDRVIVGNIEETDLLSEHGLTPNDFDLLLALDVLEHLCNPWDILAELSRYVKPGGFVVASLPNIQNIAVIQDLIGGKWQYQNAGILDATHLRFFTLDSAKLMFSGAGFNIKGIENVINPPLDVKTIKESGNRYHYANVEIDNLTKQELIDLFTYQYIIIAQKPDSTDKADAFDKENGKSLFGNDQVNARFEHDKYINNLTSLIILTYNELEYTKKCIKSIKRRTPQDHEIIFVDNGSTDGTVKWLREQVKGHKNFRLIENGKNLGFAKGCNQGIEASQGEFILLLNNDTVVSEGWLGRMLECLAFAPDAGIVGPMTNSISGLQAIDDNYGSVEYLDTYAAKFKEGYRHRRIPLRRIVGFCMLFKRSLAEQIGLLDESFGTGNFEDDDFCLRAELAGYRNYIAGDVVIHHFGSRSFIGNRIDYGAAIAGNRKVIDRKWTLSTRTEEGKKLYLLRATEMANEIYQQGRIDQAVETLVNATKFTPDAKEIYYALMRMFTETGRFAEAWGVMGTIPEAAKNEQETMKYAGYIKEGLDLDDEASTYVDKMLSLNGNSSSALNLKGVLAYKKGNIEEARECFQKAIDSDPGYGEAYANLGVLSWGQESKEEGYENLRKGFILSPDVPDIHSLYYSVVSSLGRFSEAEADFREAARFYPNNKNIVFLLIDILIQQGKLNDAIKKIQDVLALFDVDEGTLNAALPIRENLGPLTIDESSKKGTLSLCMIVKNEEKHLIKCLKSVRDIVDEIIIVDTGSTDRTREIATVFGAKVFDFPWTGDFSEARNYSLTQASGDWILILDADEVISSLDHKRLLETIDRGKRQPVAFAIVTRNYLTKSGTAGWTENDGSYPQEEKGVGWFESSKVRLFRNNSGICFENPVHELVEASLRRQGIPVEKCNVPVHHYGRLDEEKIRAKGEEYYLLGRKKLEEHGGGGFTALRELAVQACEIGKFEEAIDLWQQVLALRPDNVEALFNLAYNYIYTRKYQEALNVSRRAFELSPRTRDVLLNYALSEMFTGNVLKTKALLEEVVTGELEVPTLLALLGASHFITGDNDKGLTIFRNLAEKQIKIVAYVHSLLEQIIAAGQTEYFKRLIDAVVYSNIADHETLRRQVTPRLNSTAKQFHAQGKQDEASLILNATMETKIGDAETEDLLEALQQTKVSSR